MDAVDVRLLWYLTQEKQGFALNPDFRKSIRMISKVSGLNRELVRRHLAHMRDYGLLNGWLPALNPCLMGKKVAKLWFDIDLSRGIGSKSEMIADLKEMPAAIVIVSHIGSSMILLVLYQNESELGEITKSAMQKAGGFNLVTIHRETQPCKYSPTRTDWAILDAIFSDPSMSTARLAAAAGLSPRTIKRRVDMLVKENVIMGFPRIDWTKVDNMLNADLLLACERARRSHLVNEVLGRFRVYLVHANLVDDVDSFTFMLPGIPKRNEILQWIASRPGVVHARLEVVEAVVVAYEPLNRIGHALIKQRLGS